MGLITNHTRQDIRDALNKRVGSTITTKNFVKKAIASNYLCTLTQSGYLERLSLGEYKILKKVKLKKKGAEKGKRTNQRIKDLSTLPSILNSLKDGLVMRQIQAIYENITPKEKRVGPNYLYRIFKFAKKQGIVIENGGNKKLRKEKGPNPKRLILTNPYITIKEWNQVVEDYRLYYQYKKEIKIKRKSKPKTIMEKFKDSESIIHCFNEDRDNQNKQFVEDYFLNTVQKHLVEKHINCFVITGPDYIRHTTKLFNKIANKAIICELKADVFDIIYRKAQICPYYIDNKVSLLNCNVDDISPSNCQYIDLDLMGSISSIYKSITKQIKNQDHNCDKNSLKFLTFTASTRNDRGVNKRIGILKKLLDYSFGLKLEGFQGGEGFGEGVELFNKTQSLNSCLQRIPKITDYGRVKDICIFTYQDHNPMISILVVYK